MKDSISAFFPCYNDEQTIAEIVRKARKILSRITDHFEIIVIDDGSKDQSRKILKGLQKEIPELKLIFHRDNKGYGAALKSGFAAAKKDLVFYTDGDGQYDVAELTKLLSALKDDIDVVNGYKIKRADPFFRRLVGKVYQFFVKRIFNLPIRDPHCSFRLIRREILKDIILKSQGGALEVELIKKIAQKGGKFKEVDVHHYPRKSGQSQFFNWRNIYQTLNELWQVYLETKR